MASSEGDQLIAGAFHVIMYKIYADVLQIVKKWIGNESSYIKHTSSERFQPYMPVLHQSTCTFKAGLWLLGKI